MNLQEQWKKILDRNCRVLNITHRDLDGISSSVIIQNVFKNVTFESIKYGTVNEYLKQVDHKKFDLIIMTDISPESEDMFSKYPNIFLLDHHSTSTKFHCPEKNRIVLEGKCAATLVKEFFENLFKIDLSYLNSFCNIVNVYDMWYMEDKNWDIAWSLNELYFDYFDCDFRKRFSNGDMKFKESEIKYIGERRKLIKSVYENLDIYELDSINAAFFIETRFVNDLCHKLMDEKGYQLTICINPKSKSCSVRSNMKNLHAGKMLETLGIGGGHEKACAFRLNENEEISDKIDMIEKYLFWNCEDIKK